MSFNAKLIGLLKTDKRFVNDDGELLIAAVQDQAIGAMRLVRGLAPEYDNDFEVFSNDSLIEAFNNIAGIVAIGAFVISAIALLASGVGVMNIMLVSVTERTKEIGVRKSISARKRSILAQFLIEAVTISLASTTPAMRSSSSYQGRWLQRT